MDMPILLALLPPVKIDMETGLEGWFNQAHVISPPLCSHPGDNANRLHGQNPLSKPVRQTMAQVESGVKYSRLNTIPLHGRDPAESAWPVPGAYRESIFRAAGGFLQLA